VTDTTDLAVSDQAITDSDGDGRDDLSALRLPQLQAMAAEMGISGTARMRKSDLLEAIKARQNGAAPGIPTTDEVDEQAASATEQSQLVVIDPVIAESAGDGAIDTSVVDTPLDSPAVRRASAPAGPPPPREAPAAGHAEQAEPAEVSATAPAPAAEAEQPADSELQAESSAQPASEAGPDARTDERRDRRTGRDGRSGQDRPAQERTTQDGRPAEDRDGQQRDDDDEGDGGRGRRRRGRYRDRKRRSRGDQNTGGAVGEEPEVGEDDVLVPVAGILDVLDNYAFLRTSGYLPGPNDVYVSLGQVKKYGLRKGDAVVGAVRQQREGEPQRQKFNALVRLDTINGASADEARTRPEFAKLTPLYPQERLRLETDPNQLTTRIIDLIAPVGKGQRGLIVSPSKAGKTLVLQAMANAITRNNPECHLMVVLVDERPEEVTDMQRAVKGEVIASTFDRPADDHTTVAELAIERAKRLVELGHDVVVLLDSITRLGRAYNLAAPASGRILSGGVDSSALYPPKRFFGAARNIEHGGSLTILATALVETGSKMDEVIFEEFKGTGNMELKLSRQLADKRIFPAVDVNASGTRREEILMSREELNIVWKLRRVMGALEAQQSIELLLDRLKQTRSNAEFLMQVQKTTPVPGRSEDD
jgi:transcription termination factor Rho